MFQIGSGQDADVLEPLKCPKWVRARYESVGPAGPGLAVLHFVHAPGKLELHHEATPDLDSLVSSESSHEIAIELRPPFPSFFSPWHQDAEICGQETSVDYGKGVDYGKF